MEDIRLTPLEHDILKSLTPFWTRYVLTDTVKRLGCSLDEFNQAASSLVEQGLIEGQEHETYVLMRAIPQQVPAPPTDESPLEKEPASESEAFDDVDELDDDDYDDLDEPDYPELPIQDTLF